MMVIEDDARRTSSGRPLPARTTELVACPDCGLQQRLPASARGQIAECRCCARVLAGLATGRLSAPLALFIGTFMLLAPAMLAPLFAVSTYGVRRQSWLPSSVTALWHDGFPSLGVVVALFTIALPIVYLSLLIWVLGSLRWNQWARRGDARAAARSHAPRRNARQPLIGIASGPWRTALGVAYRWAQHLRPWVMAEVYLVGSFVAYSRIKVLASVDVGAGGWCLLAAGLVLLIAVAELDDRTVWSMLRPKDDPSPAGAIIGCTVCDHVVAADTPMRRCPRCRGRLHARKPNSMQRTTALVVAGCLLYVPANLLPVLTTVRLGHEEHNTILSGVVELARNDLWPLAVIVFVASIVLPLVKLCGLSWMLIATRVHSARYLPGRTRLLRTIDTVGRWSNIDVFAVSVLVAVLQFGALTAVHAGNGLVAFAAVVIITMFATSVFDGRLMWDAARPVRAHG